MPARLREGLFGREPAQRMRASQAFLVLTMQVFYAGVQNLEVLVGLIDFQASWPLSAFGIGSGLFFYAVIRSGLNLRLKHRRSLPVPQTFCALLCLNWSYAITGPARGAILLIISSVILFGIFSLPPRQLRQLAGVTLTMLAGVMVWACRRQLAPYDPRVEVVHFAFAALVFGMVAALAARIAEMKHRLQAQKRELGSALERIQLLATRDELTGLLNRRAARDRLESALRAGAAAARPPLSIALIDLDHFKRINDRLGHGAGDAVLRRFAEVGRLEMRGSDLLARWGGEEFLMMVPSANAAEAALVLDRIRRRLRGLTFDDIDSGLAITFSAGVAECADDSDLESAIERADVAMYAAKRDGRDRTELAGAAAGTPATADRAADPPAPGPVRLLPGAVLAGERAAQEPGRRRARPAPGPQPATCRP